MSLPAISLSSAALDIKIGKVAHGLMNMTARFDPLPDEQCFETLKASLDSVRPGEKVLISGGEMYGLKPRWANLELLNRFFTKYPGYANKAFLSIKGGSQIWNEENPSMMPDASPANLRKSVENIVRTLGPNKQLDLFECGRVDPRVPIEDTIRTLAGFIDEGLFSHIGMSEVSAATLRRAHAVHPIAAVEIEISPWSYEEETKKVIAAGEELGITVLGYSPMGRGFLTDSFRLEENDIRKMFPRFRDEAIEHNQVLAHKVRAIAKTKGVSSAQLCIAWVSHLGPHVVPLAGSSAPERLRENNAAADIKLTDAELKELNNLITSFEVIGGRYPEEFAAHLWA